MINKSYYQALRFEKRYGDGSIIDTIVRLNNGDALKTIAHDLSKIYPISPPQLMRYMRVFASQKHCPTDVTERFYFVRQKDRELKDTTILINEVDVSLNNTKVIHVNFSQGARTA